LCGELCPDLCRICDEKKLKNILEQEHKVIACEKHDELKLSDKGDRSEKSLDNDDKKEILDENNKENLNNVAKSEPR